MSIEETNAMRASLGLRPLDVEKNSDTPCSKPQSSQPADGNPKRQVVDVKMQRDHEEFIAGEGLGEISMREEGGRSVADWVAETRNCDGQMKAVGASKPENKKKEPVHVVTAPNLKVRHSVEALPYGGTAMTLADRPILDGRGNIDDQTPDELVNVNIVDAEVAEHNQALRDRIEYDPSKEGQDILDKYDDLKIGTKGFMLGGTLGVLEETDPEKRLAILTKQSLETEIRFQSDRYTTEEMATFKKPKKKVKRRTRQSFEAREKDDLLPVATGGRVMAQPGKIADVGSDEEDPELYEQLSKQRRLVRRSDAGAVRKGEAAIAAVSETIRAIPSPDLENEKATSAGKVKEGELIAMTATTEFCNVVQTPLEKLDTLKHESFRGSTLYKQQAQQRKGIKAGQKRGYTLHEEAPSQPQQMEDQEAPLVEEAIDLSCASGLAYLRARAQIGCDQDSHRHRKSDNRPLEMSTVDGDIKLEYRDDFGRVQTPKEAFRAISWKFHGKVPGRKNMERRILRLENEMRLKTMNPLESLPTLRALRHVQHVDAKPYMVLSGANEK